MDAIVIGAGLAGLAAAARLVAAGRGVVVLEARDRLGGRVWTRSDAELAAPVELGAEWFEGAGAIHELLGRAGAPTRPARGDWFRRSGDRWLDARNLPGGRAPLLDRLRTVGGADATLADALARCCAEQELVEDRRRLLAYVEGFHAADPERLSTHWLTEVEKTQPAGTSDCRTPNGLDHAIRSLAGGLERRSSIRLETAARVIRWRPGWVEVDAEGRGGAETFVARSAIVTVPLAVLGELRFEPELPEKRAAARGLEMGDVVKLVLRCREPFWRDVVPLRKALFFQDPEQPFPTWWTAEPPTVPHLTAWVGGPRATRLLAERRGSLGDLAIDSLAHALGIPRRDVEAEVRGHDVHDWHADPFARGAYTYVVAGGAGAPRDLARAVERTLHFAGEATCGGGLNATMEGALQSGRRAADEVLGVG